MRKFLVIALALVVFLTGCFLFGMALAGNDPHKVNHLTQHHSVSTPVPVAASFFSTRQGGVDGRPHRVNRLRAHHHLGDAHQSRSRSALNQEMCRTWGVTVEGTNFVTGKMQVMGNAKGKLCYVYNCSCVTKFQVTDTSSAVGFLVWSPVPPIPYHVVNGHGRASCNGCTSGYLYHVYRRIYFRFDGDWKIGGVGTHQSVTPYVAITARGNGTFTFGKGGL